MTQANAGLGNFVFEDLDGDGIQDPNEPGLENVKVFLHDDNGNIVGIQFTDFNGNYLFEDLSPGHYYVRFETPEGFEVTTANSGNNDNTDSDIDNSNGPGTTANSWVDPGELDLSFDAGFHMCIPIGDYLWLDWNSNGFQDGTENGINGVRVNLYRVENGASFLHDFATTGPRPNSPSDDGYFKFCAPPGQYYLEFILNTNNFVATNAGQAGPETDSNVN